MALLPLVGGCSSLPSVHGISLGSPTPPASQYQAEPARHEGGTLVVGDWESPTNFSPLFNEEVPAAQVDALLYAGLVRLDPNLQPVPDLVERVPTLDNGDVTWNRGAGTMDVTYRLRPGLRWSDGQPLTADDVAFTWRLIVNPKVQGVLSPDGYAAISRIDIHDLQRFTLHFDRVYPKFLNLFPAVLPQHRLSGIAPGQLAGDPFWARPDVVSGPFKISELVPDDHITLLRNDAWSQGRGGRRVHLDGIVYKIYPEAGQLLDAARAGQVSMALELPDDQLATLANTGSMTVQRRSQLAYEQVTFNQTDPNPLTGQPPLWKNDPVLLQALRTAIDRPAIVKKFFADRARLAESPIPSVLASFHDPDVSLAYNLAAATKLLDGDGWAVGSDGIRSKNGRRLSFHIVTALGSPLRSAVRDELVVEWRKVGAEVIATEAHPSELFSGYAQGGLLERGQFEAGLWTWSIGPDPDGVYPLEHSSQIPTDQNQGQGSNFGRFNNPDLDRNLDKGRMSLVTVERARSYAAFERAYARLGFELPLFERVLVVLSSPHLHNLAPNAAPDTTLWNAADWWID
ncbi:MAG TPA: peptide ABC transporter substrate-binding protein [Candidatus Dormibacteraeota bacterium]|nr:peptide ABC transporter substrate-binding protein [Candidatus Dormibacteraeota bacterium]